MLEDVGDEQPAQDELSGDDRAAGRADRADRHRPLQRGGEPGRARLVDGLHDALLVGAALAAAGAIAAALLIPRHFGAGAQVEDLATHRGPELAAEAA